MPRAIGRPLLIIVIALLAAGCRSYTTVPVDVVDAETGRPISNGRVSVTHLGRMTLLFPPGTRSASLIHGTAELRVPDQRGLNRFEAEAPGYLKGRPTSVGQAPSARDGKTASRVRIELYQEPAPVILMTLPAGHRGIVVVSVPDPSDEELDRPPGQRLFTFSAGASDITALPSSPLLRRVIPEQYYAQYADGTPLPSSPWGYPDAAAFRLVRTFDRVDGYGRVHLFLVGTVAEKWDLKSRLPPYASRPTMDQLLALRRPG